ncbi:unnamed protein product [Phytomonas sp. Hart1]|nr:unnamed protein product [Phytomonas sp. Hart1]|eukprot:CCW70841.1 unnamed protein product [Phytomonas sp. isolate Hart1]
MQSEVSGLKPATDTSSSPTFITPIEERKSSLYLTKFEIARIVGERAREIVSGTAIKFSNNSEAGLDLYANAAHCLDPFSSSVDPIMMAKMELLQGKIPMIVSRTWPDGTREVIPIKELLVDPAMIDLEY